MAGVGELGRARPQWPTPQPTSRTSAFVLPKGAPHDIVDKLNQATHVAMDTPATKARLNGIGVINMPPERRGPDYLAEYVVEEIARWEGPIKASGLQVD